MILVNISAVGTSTTLTLHPVSFSHIGPEKLSGSSDCSPASQTMVMVFPAQIFLAASAAVLAALCAPATPAAASVTAATSTPASQPGRRKPGERFFMVSPPLRTPIGSVLLNGSLLVRFLFELRFRADVDCVFAPPECQGHDCRAQRHVTGNGARWIQIRQR